MFDAPRILLILCVLMLLLIIAATYSYQTAWTEAEPHPGISTMEVGGARAVEDSQHWILGLAFGVVTVLSLIASLLFATQHTKYASQLTLAIMIGGLAYVAVFVGMMFSYRDYAQQGASLIGPFTAPTTWMVLGLWAVPVIFVAMYCVKFNTWFASESETSAESESN